jgi:hypothetical protein
LGLLERPPDHVTGNGELIRAVFGSNAVDGGGHHDPREALLSSVRTNPHDRATHRDWQRKRRLGGVLDIEDGHLVDQEPGTAGGIGQADPDEARRVIGHPAPSLTVEEDTFAGPKSIGDPLIHSEDRHDRRQVLGKEKLVVVGRIVDVHRPDPHRPLAIGQQRLDGRREASRRDTELPGVPFPPHCYNRCWGMPPG